MVECTDWSGVKVSNLYFSISTSTTTNGIKLLNENDTFKFNISVLSINIYTDTINATKKLKSKEKIIDVDIREKETRLLVKIENPCKTNLKFDEVDYGIGISSVITTTEKYEGMYDFTAQDGTFSSKVCLNY